MTVFQHPFSAPTPHSRLLLSLPVMGGVLKVWAKSRALFSSDSTPKYAYSISDYMQVRTSEKLVILNKNYISYYRQFICVMNQKTFVLSSNKNRNIHYDYCTTQLFSCIVMTWLSLVQINTTFQKIECFHSNTCYGDFTHTALGHS